MTNITVTVSHELLERSFQTGNKFDAIKVLKGLPPEAKLKAVSFTEDHHLEFIFEDKNSQKIDYDLTVEFETTQSQPDHI